MPGLSLDATYACSVTATNAVGQGPASPSTTSVRVPGLPVVSALSPSTGSTLGGQQVTLTGVDLIDVDGVRMGENAATYTAVSPTEIRLQTPAHAPGAVVVVVSTAIGSSTATPGAAFTYQGIPKVSGLRAAAGDGRIRVDWTVPANPNGLSLEVHRAASEAGPWQAVDTLPLASSGLDVPGPDGQRIWIRARVLDGAAQGEWSEPVSAIPHAPTTCGNLTGDEVWSGTLIITCNVNVGSHTLTIEPGSSVMMQGSITVSNEGALSVTGTTPAKVVLTNQCPPNNPACAAINGTTDASSTARITLEQTVSTGVRVTGTRLDLLNNRFSGSTVLGAFGSPQVRGNSFAGIERPLTLTATTDLAGVKNNTATGPAENRIFTYTNANVSGHWTPEATTSGVIHRIDNIRVLAGGHADLVNTTTAIYSLDVSADGALSITGPDGITTRACDTAVIGTTGCYWSDPQHKADIEVNGDGTLNTTTAHLTDIQLTLGTDASDPNNRIPAQGTITDTTITTSTIQARPASLTWTNNTFTASTMVQDYRSPQIRGNSFAGIEMTPHPHRHHRPGRGEEQHRHRPTPRTGSSPTPTPTSAATGPPKPPPPEWSTASTTSASSPAATPTWSTPPPPSTPSTSAPTAH